MGAAEGSGLADRVAALFRPGQVMPGDWVVLEVRPEPDEVVLLVRREGNPQRYGIPIPLAETRQDFFYTGFPVASDEEWLESVALGMSIRMDTGFVVAARRRDRGEYIELREEGGWPEDRRFFHQDGSHEPYRLAEALERDGLDVRPVRRLLGDGTLLAWLVMYENNSTGMPFLGYAAISRVGSSVGRLECLEVVEGVPLPAKLDLAYYCSHRAAEQGASIIETSLDEPGLDIIGFRRSPDGIRRLDTAFTDADPDAARRLLAEALRRPSAWGQDRDLQGRHIPSSRIGRAWHSLRFGRQGRPSRIRVG